MCNDDVKVVSVHTALGLSVAYTHLYCVLMNSSLTVCLAVCSSRLTGGHVRGQPCDDQLIVEEEKIKRAT